MVVEHPQGHVECAGVEQDPGLGSLRRRCTRRRPLLHEVGCALGGSPRRVIESSVQHDQRRRAPGPNDGAVVGDEAAQRSRRDANGRLGRDGRTGEMDRGHNGRKSCCTVRHDALRSRVGILGDARR